MEIIRGSWNTGVLKRNKMYHGLISSECNKSLFELLVFWLSQKHSEFEAEFMEKISRLSEKNEHHNCTQT